MSLRSLILVLFASAALLLHGCVELTGQRISWRYDAASDSLEILIFYDGVHDSGDNQHGDGREQIPAFVNAGSILILDWPFHIDRAKLDNKQPGDNPLEARTLALIRSLQVEAIGFYREPNGRSGAVQRVTIPKASAFIREVNALINESMVKADPPEEGDEMRRTAQRMQEAARNGHQWITLDGQAIRVQVPIHGGEWAEAKREGLTEIARGILEGHDDEETRHGLRAIVTALSAMPVSYIEAADSVTVILGDKQQTSTLRMLIRDEYNDELENVLSNAVPVNLDAALANALLAGAPPADGPVRAVLDFGPPEAQVKALLTATQHGPPDRRAQATRRLNDWANQWNDAGRFPPAPALDDPNAFPLDAWNTWYDDIKGIPPFELDDDDHAVEEHTVPHDHDDGHDHEAEEAPRPKLEPIPD